MPNQCPRCQTQTIWKELPPSSVHAYRVTCSLCDRFLMWGTRVQLNIAQANWGVRNLVNYQPPATLEAFFQD